MSTPQTKPPRSIRARNTPSTGEWASTPQKRSTFNATALTRTTTTQASASQTRRYNHDTARTPATLAFNWHKHATPIDNATDRTRLDQHTHPRRTNARHQTSRYGAGTTATTRERAPRTHPPSNTAFTAARTPCGCGNGKRNPTAPRPSLRLACRHRPHPHAPTHTTLEPSPRFVLRAVSLSTTTTNLSSTAGAPGAIGLPMALMWPGTGPQDHGQGTGGRRHARQGGYDDDADGQDGAVDGHALHHPTSTPRARR